MTPGATSVALTRLIGVVALAITLLPPAGFFLVRHEGVAHSLMADARVQAVIVTDIVGRNTKIWNSAHERLLEAIEPVRDTRRATLILDDRNRLVTEAHADLTWPTIAKEEEFFDFGVAAGRVRVVASLAEILLQTALVLALSAALGFAVFVPLRQMPVRALKRASEALARGALSRSLVDGLNESVILTNDQMTVIASNRSVEYIEGIACPIIVGANLIDCLHGATHEDGEAFAPEQWPMQRCLATRQPDGPVIVQLRTEDGRRISLSLKASPIRHGEQDEHQAVVTLIEDITERKATADRLILTERAVQSARDAMVITDATTRIVLVNDAFCTLTGYEKEQAIGQSTRILRSGRQEQAFYSTMWAHLSATGAWSGEVWNRHRNGEIYPAWLSISEVRDHRERVTHYIGTMSDISERLQAEQHVRQLARSDSLTGLPNRTHLREKLGQALAAARRHGGRVGVFFIDLDRFKLINDTKGHLAGDIVLGEVARRLTAAVRDEDTVGRLAGDEFVAFMPNIKSDAALVTIAENILESLARPIIHDGDELFVTISIGVVVYPDDGADVDALLSNADTAMYAAKAAGRANVKFFAPAMNEAGRHQLETSHAVKVGLARDEFVLYFQPQVATADTGRIVGSEALIRWNHPERGLVMPGEFIPVIEGTRLIIDVGNWVIDQALRQSDEWRRKGLDVCISVNVSPLQFQQDDFVDGLRRAAARHDFVPGSIRLEVTENLLLGDPEACLKSMNQVRALGFQLSLDDFGTGYSSLAYLARFPFNELKIDRSFVSRLTRDGTAEAIVDAVIVLGHALDLWTIAEGVETEAEADILRRLDCGQMQGYLYGRPMPAEDFEHLLHHRATAPRSS